MAYDFVAALADRVRVAVPVLCCARIAVVGAPDPGLGNGTLSVDDQSPFYLLVLAAAAVHRAGGDDDDDDDYDAAEARAAIGVGRDVPLSVFVLPRGAMHDLVWMSPGGLGAPGVTVYVIGARAPRPAEVPAYVPFRFWMSFVQTARDAQLDVGVMHEYAGRTFCVFVVRAVCSATRTAMPLRMHDGDPDSAAEVAYRDWWLLDGPHEGRVYTASVPRPGMVQCFAFEPFAIDVPRRRWDGIRRAVVDSAATGQPLSA